MCMTASSQSPCATRSLLCQNQLYADRTRQDAPVSWRGSKCLCEKIPREGIELLWSSCGERPSRCLLSMEWSTTTRSTWRTYIFLHPSGWRKRQGTPMNPPRRLQSAAKWFVQREDLGHSLEQYFVFRKILTKNRKHKKFYSKEELSLPTTFHFEHNNRGKRMHDGVSLWNGG